MDVPWLAALQRDTAARLEHSSTAIEGNHLSLLQVQGVSREDKVQTQEKSRGEFLNYFKTLAWVEKESPNVRFTKKKFFLMHRLITQGLVSQDQVGCYKIKQNRVVDGPREGCLHSAGTGGLSQADERSHSLDQSESGGEPLSIDCWGGSSSPDAIDSSVRGWQWPVFPHFFGVWVLFTLRFDMWHLFAWDEYFEADRSQYYQEIQQARELDDDLTYWLEYTALGLQAALEKTRDRITALQIKKKGARFTVTAQQEQVLKFIREHGKVKSAEIGSAFKFTRSRVNQVVKPLVDAGILKRAGETRATTYAIA